MKVRRVDYYPDDFITGVAGQLSFDEIGMYWLLCSLMYAQGGSVIEDHARFAYMGRTRKDHVRRLIDRLVEVGKLHRNGGELYSNRVRNEIERASNRMRKAHENAAKGGRPSKENKAVAKPGGLFSEKLSSNNHQSSTNNTEAAFAAWYELYPRREGRGQAERAYKAALKRPGVTPQLLLDRMVSWAPTQAGKDRQYIPYPATWLNGRRWEDQDGPPLLAAVPPDPERDRKVKAWMAAIDKATRECIGTADPRFPKRSDYGLEDR